MIVIKIDGVPQMKLNSYCIFVVITRATCFYSAPVDDTHKKVKYYTEMDYKTVPYRICV